MTAPTAAPRRRFSVLGTILGAVVGGAVNMALILGSAAALPPPPGVDVQDPATINAHIGEYTVLQLLLVFAAHALGTLVGAFVATRIALRGGTGRLPALLIGLLFLAGGIEAVRMIPDAPKWFDALDLVVAYLPMAYFGHRLARPRR